MTKVTSIEGGKKSDPEHCPFCDAVPACPGWTCPRLKAVEIWPDGGHRVEFVDDPLPEDLPAA